MSTPIPADISYSTQPVQALPGLSADSGDARANRNPEELTPAAAALPGGDRVELSEEGMDLLGAAKGLPGEGARELEEGEPPFCNNCGTFHFPSGDGDATVSPVAQQTNALAAPTGSAAAAPDADVPEFPASAATVEATSHAHGPGETHSADEALKEGAGDGASVDPGATGLDPREQAEVERLEERDREVRAHEQAHAAAGGQYVRGGYQYEYATGPDGRRYAVGGEVSIDTSPVPGDPQATILKAQAIRRAALAPSEPSSADRSVAAAASRMEAEARRELLEEETAAAATTQEEASTGSLSAAGPTDDAQAPALLGSGSAAAGEIPEPGLGGPESLVEQPTPLEELSGVLVSVKPKDSDGGGEDGGLSALMEEVEKGLPEPSSAGGGAPPQMSLDYGSQVVPGGMLDVRA